MAETTYIVLRRYDTRDVERQPSEVELWAIVQRVEDCGSASHAVRHACEIIAEDGGKPAGTYVAVPARSWKPVTVQAVQTTVLKLEEATTPPPAGPS